MITPPCPDGALLRELVKEIPALEQCAIDAAEAPEDHFMLTPLAARLQQVSALLQFIYAPGARTLVAETQALVEALIEGAVRRPELALDALMRAVVELGGRLERRFLGAPDNPLLYLFLLNDLRAARGAELFSDSALLAPISSTQAIAAEDFDEQLLRQRPVIMRAVLHWLRNAERRALQPLQGALDILAERAGASRDYWLAGRALVDGIVLGTLKSGAAERALIGQVERALRAVKEQSESTFMHTLGARQLRSLLFYSALVGPASAAATTLEQRYDLDNVRPLESGHALQLRPAYLHSAKSMLEQDLEQVCDALEVLAHAPDARLDETLAPVTQTLAQMCQIAALLGLAQTQQVGQALQTQIQQMVAGLQQRAEAEDLAPLARAALQLQQALSEDFEPVVQPDSKFLQHLPASISQDLSPAFIRESLRPLQRAREALDVLFQDSAHIQSIDQVIDALTLLSRVFHFTCEERLEAHFERAAEVFSRALGRMVGLSWQAPVIEQVALWMAALELHLSHLANEAHETYFELAQNCLTALSECEFGDEQETSTVLDADFSDDPDLDDGLPEALRDTFVDEALEALQVIFQALPRWQSDNQLTGELQLVARAYHTLKGSGRIVAADALADFSESQEQLLNALLLHGPQGRLAIIQPLLDEGMGMLPQLIEQVAGSGEGVEGQEELCAACRAEARWLTAVTAERDAQLGDAQVAERRALPTRLSDVFAQEAASHIDVLLQQFCHRDAGAVSVEKSVLHALHTLRGSAHAARVASIAQLAVPLHTLVQHYANRQVPLSGQALALVRRATQALQSILAALADGVDDAEEWAPLAAQLAACAPTSAPLEDDEATSVFVDEAQGLIAQLRVGLPGADQEHYDARPALRILHTLKGAANLVGAAEIANLSHAFEGALGDWPRWRGESGGAQLQEALDALAMNVEQLRQGEPMGSFGWLIGALEQGPYEVSDASSKADAGRQVPLEAPPTAPVAQTSPLMGAEEEDAPQALSGALRINDDELQQLSALIAEAQSISHQDSGQIDRLRQQGAEQHRVILRLRRQLAEFEDLLRANAWGASAEPSEELAQFGSADVLHQALQETLCDFESLHFFSTQALAELGLRGAAGREVEEALNARVARWRLVPLSRYRARFNQLIQRAANDAGCQVKLNIVPESAQIDRQLLQNLLSPLEHLLRNAVLHGIEPADQRRALGKPEYGLITLLAEQKDKQQRVSVVDDGAGIDYAQVRQRAAEDQLLADPEQADEAVLQKVLILSGFTTRDLADNWSGRGIGLDVVAQSLRALGGALSISSTPGAGARFELSVPHNQVFVELLLFQLGEEIYALTTEDLLASVDATHLDHTAQALWPGQNYQRISVAQLLDLPSSDINAPHSALFVEHLGQRFVLLVDALLGRRRCLMSPSLPLLQQLDWCAGASITDEGQIVLLLDSARIIGNYRSSSSEHKPTSAALLIVDDSITVRKVMQRMLERLGFRVRTARDGLDALQQIQREKPAALLLDIEMPRMDGFELLEALTDQGRVPPTVIISSRVGARYRDQAARLGVYHFLAKPCQEQALSRVFAELGVYGDEVVQA